MKTTKMIPTGDPALDALRRQAKRLGGHPTARDLTLPPGRWVLGAYGDRTEPADLASTGERA